MLGTQLGGIVGLQQVAASHLAAASGGARAFEQRYVRQALGASSGERRALLLGRLMPYEGAVAGSGKVVCSMRQRLGSTGGGPDLPSVVLAAGSAAPEATECGTSLACRFEAAFAARAENQFAACGAGHACCK